MRFESREPVMRDERARTHNTAGTSKIVASTSVTDNYRAPPPQHSSIAMADSFALLRMTSSSQGSPAMRVAQQYFM